MVLYASSHLQLSTLQETRLVFCFINIICVVAAPILISTDSSNISAWLLKTFIYVQAIYMMFWSLKIINYMLHPNEQIKFPLTLAGNPLCHAHRLLLTWSAVLTWPYSYSIWLIGRVHKISKVLSFFLDKISGWKDVYFITSRHCANVQSPDRDFNFGNEFLTWRYIWI